MKNKKVWIGIGISVISLYLVARQMQWKEVWDALQGVNAFWIIAGVGVFAVSMVGRAMRWRALLYPRTDLRLSALFDVMNMGYLLSNIFPARLGDVARAYLLSQVENVEAGRVLSSVIVERITDVLTVLLFLMILLPFVPLPGWLIKGSMAAAFAAILLAVVLIAVSYQKERITQIYRAVASRIPILDREVLYSLLKSVIDGFAVLRTPEIGPQMFGWSLFAWAFTVLFQFTVALAFRESAANLADLRIATFTICAIAFGMMIPASPGYVGVYELIMVESLKLFGIGEGTALGYTLVVHALNYIVLTLLGIFGMLRQGVSFGQMTRVTTAKENVEIR